ncbi:DNA polymerase III subunit delta' [Aureimonas sp. Leaf454]|uniref:DNA polymerase III subunit delta' n=1 Tax=Aureimonas sp. Leaf454 TaxID=1736381 RepID=UPI0006F3E5C6|nr:DNA polymerase III subunit delta' [Aureimonas sp. Leaf454]KQT48686.1 DNA polymerase III subunit delta' [Aureimonas sp. Leaf454]
MSALDVVDEHDAIEGVVPPAMARIVVGQDAAYAELLKAQASDRMHHGWLLQGPRGVGKATAAFAFARRLLGSTEPGDAVDRQIAQGAHPNLIHITRPSNERTPGFKTQITVEEIRRLNRFFQATTSGGQWRIAIVDPADDMNRNAANALLKILEEPPARALFLITNHLPGRLLPTIRSRCRVLRFEPLAARDLETILGGLGLDVTETEIRSVLPLAGGGVRTAASLLASGGLDVERRIDALWSQPEADWPGLHALGDALTQKGRETALDLALASLFRRLAAESEARLDTGDRHGAERMAALWAEENARLREGTAFNLDRKQMLLTFFARLYERRSAP